VAGGAGLGLSIVKKLIEAHRGTVHVQDNQPNGSVFVVRIPIKGASVAG
jgi:signal transduction histidine kinase